MTEIKNLKKEDIIYEDDYSVVAIASTAIGHMKVYSKKGKRLNDLDDDSIERLFITASYAATMAFEGLGAQGTNLIINDMNKNESLCIEVLPRKFEDNIDLLWEPKKMTEQDFMDASKRIKDNCDLIEYKKKEKAKKEVKEVVKAESKGENKEETKAEIKGEVKDENTKNYELDKLRRIP